MSSHSIQNNITVIIAHRGSSRHLRDVILDLKLWFNDIVVVGSDCTSVIDKIIDQKRSWIKSDSCSYFLKINPNLKIKGQS